MAQGAAAKNWCFTLSGRFPDEVAYIKDVSSYIVVGREIGEKKNYLHFQGYVQLQDKMRLTALKKVSRHARWEKQMGTTDQAINYCKKDGNFIEEGEPKYERQRTDLLLLKEFLDSGPTLKQVQDEHFTQWIRYSKSIEKYLENHQKVVRNWVMDVQVYCGPTGTGKSRKAFEENPDAYVLPPVQYGSKIFFNGYNGEDVLILDDFDYNNVSYNYMLRLLDRYKLSVEMKLGGFVPFISKKVIITSSKHPNQWYPTQYDKSELLRRITTITNFE